MKVNVVTWNVNSIRARLEILKSYIMEKSPTIIAIQETKVADSEFPEEVFKSANYRGVYSGQKSYNGVAIVSKFPIEGFEKNIFEEDSEKRTILIKSTGLTILNCYFPHGDVRGEEKFFYKLEFYQRIRNYILKNGLINERFILLGDFNVAPEEKDVWDPLLLSGTIGFMKEEQDAFKGLLNIGLIDLFRMFHPDERAFTWWDYRAGAFRKNEGMRIDHILISPSLKEKAQACYIDTEPRKLKGASDHAPLWGEFSF